MSTDSDANAGSPQEKFATVLAKFGLSADSLTAQSIRTGDRPGGFVLSSDPEASHLPPTMVQVRDIAHLKELGGTPDSHYTSGTYSDKAIRYPAPLSDATRQLLQSAKDKCELEFHLKGESYADIATAAQAYVHGNSEKVKDYEPVINALHFPSQVAVFAVNDVVVQAGSPLVFAPGDPSTLSCSSLTVEPGGQVIVQENVTINSQQTTVQS